MRQTALLFVIAVLGYAANAQFTLRPQIGIENPVTKISYNDFPSFAPISQFQSQLGIHADYKFKEVRTVLGLSTNRSIVSYSFTDPEKATDYMRWEMSS
jgi:phenylalanyl-tRNA synthetase beta subunit